MVKGPPPSMALSEATKAEKAADLQVFISWPSKIMVWKEASLDRDPRRGRPAGLSKMRDMAAFTCGSVAVSREAAVPGSSRKRFCTASAMVYTPRIWRSLSAS